ncbi:MAG: flavin reductase [Bacteroidota bacterium]
MTDINALFSISYGMFIVSSGNKDRGNGYIANTFFQITSEPASFALSCSKNNFSAEMIRKTGSFAVSVLHKEASSELLGRFGYSSGRNMDKLKDMQVKYGLTGVPVVLNDAIAFIECKLTNAYDAGSHYIFIGELVHAEMIDGSKEPMTYRYYREVKKGMSPANAPTYISGEKLTPIQEQAPGEKYKCSVCGYIHDNEDEATAFNDLTDDWVCPVCGVGKNEFTKL